MNKLGHKHQAPHPSKTHRSFSMEQQIKCGIFLKSKRLLAKRSKKEVADYLEISPKNVQDYEAGILKIPLNHVRALSNCLNIPPDEIIEVFNGLK